MKKAVLIALSAMLMIAGQDAKAEPTEIVVRVMAKDAKFIGTETGGAQVTLRDAKTNKVLAQGLTAGATGNTPKIMTDPHPRGAVTSDDTSAKVAFMLDLKRPTLISATAVGPMNDKDHAITASSQQWVIPGKSVNQGDAWVLELPGFLIDVVDAVPASIKLKDARKIPLNTKITMQCGCPITPGGLWDANKIEVGAIVHHGDKALPPVKLAYAGKASSFSGEIEIAEPGDYTIDLYAYAPWDGNTGVREIKIRAK